VFRIPEACEKLPFFWLYPFVLRKWTNHILETEDERYVKHVNILKYVCS